VKGAAFCIWLALAAAPGILAQEPQNESKPESSQQGDPWLWWKWANFLILAGGIGYLVRKYAGPFYRGQSESIQRGIAEATQARKDAEARAASIDRRMAGIEKEIEELRVQSRAEMEAEGKRLREDAERQASRLQEDSVQEIELMTRAAILELKRYSADLALDLAEQRIRTRVTPDTRKRLANGFIRDLDRKPNHDATAQ
jgi:F-type H+-transporting ATPase subunit b